MSEHQAGNCKAQSPEALARVKAQIAELEKLMRKNRYVCHQNSELQENYRRLLRIRSDHECNGPKNELAGRDESLRRDKL